MKKTGKFLSIVNDSAPIVVLLGPDLGDPLSGGPSSSNSSSRPIVRAERVTPVKGKAGNASEMHALLTCTSPKLATFTSFGTTRSFDVVDV